MFMHILKRQTAAAIYIEITMSQLSSNVCDITGKSVTLKNSPHYHHVAIKTS